ncbi:MAG TPA: GNAT family N-acetyltransferase [Bacilli bacterium]
MRFSRVTPEKLEKYRLPFIRFAAQHGEKRITDSAIAWLKTVQPEQLADKGSEMIAASIGGKLAAISCVAHYGNEAAFYVVHPAYRRRGIGKRLLSLHLSRLGRYRCAVAADNQPSLRLCQSCGLKPVWQYNNSRGKRIIVLEGESVWPAPRLE